MFNSTRYKKQHLMNKSTMSVFFMTITMSLGCSNAQDEPNNITRSGGVNQSVNAAVANKDYRLYATSGRRITFPGIKNSEYVVVEESCGKKYYPKTGDVISSEAEREQRKKTIDYMTSYNQKMFKVCSKR